MQIQDRVSRYEVIVSLSGDLLYLRTMGAEYTTGAHFDEYIMDFSSFTELDAEDEAPFTLPPECSRRPLQSGVQPMAVALASLAPDVRPHTNLDLTGLAVRLRRDRMRFRQLPPIPPFALCQQPPDPESWLRETLLMLPSNASTCINPRTQMHRSVLRKMVPVVSLPSWMYAPWSKHVFHAAVWSQILSLAPAGPRQFRFLGRHLMTWWVCCVALAGCIIGAAVPFTCSGHMLYLNGRAL